jgi:VWFA-related protein
VPLRAAWIWASLPLALWAQDGDSPVVLRTETRAVEIDAVVKDQAGQAIRGLRQEDFTLADDGKPRAIQFFSAEADPDLDPLTGLPIGRPARLAAIVLDGLNTEFSDQSYAQEQAVRAVEHMALNESIAILELAPGLKLQDFTRDRSRLLAAIQAYRPNLPPYPMRQRVQVTLAALKNMARRMNGATGRKSILWITGGFPHVRAYDRAMEETLKQINDCNVALYPIDARGLTVGRPSNLDILDQFAQATGGAAYYNRNDVAAAIEEAAEDARATYVVGFYLTEHERDHRFHELTLAVRRPGATVRCRRGYSPTSISSNAP